MELTITIPEKTLPLLDALRRSETAHEDKLEDWLEGEVSRLLMDMVQRQKQREAENAFAVEAKAEAFVEVKLKRAAVEVEDGEKKDKEPEPGLGE